MPLSSARSILAFMTASHTVRSPGVFAFSATRLVMIRLKYRTGEKTYSQAVSEFTRPAGSTAARPPIASFQQPLPPLSLQNPFRPAPSAPSPNQTGREEALYAHFSDEQPLPLA